MQTAKLQIESSVWNNLISELKKRGKGITESGAFLLAKPDSNQIVSFICYDDLDPNCYDTGIIVFQGKAYKPLWEHCSKNSLMVIADVHTHPRRWTRQSNADKQHPMIIQSGHFSLIVPYYAQNKAQSLKGVGVYEYMGNKEWKTYKSKKKAITIL